MIKETLIDTILESLEHSDPDSDLLDLRTRHPELHAYLLSEQFDLLTEEELQWLLFNGLVIVRCFEAENHSFSITSELLEDCESANWKVMDSATPASFSDKLDVFFTESNQEDLLAYIEDSLADDEDKDLSVSPVAREILFITLKSVVDAFDRLLEDSENR